MKLHEFIHATTRTGWTARLVAYIALVVTLCALFEIAKVVWM